MIRGITINSGITHSLAIVAVFLSLSRISVAEDNEHVEMAAQPGMATQMTPAQARTELQRLIDESIFVASQQLNKSGTFYPYGAVMESTGEIKLVGVPETEQDKPAPKQTLKALKKALAQLAKKKRYRAVAIFVDFVAIRKDTAARQSGIRIELEHRLPDKLSVFLPYYRTPDDIVRLLTPQYMPGTLSVLVPPK